MPQVTRAQVQTFVDTLPFNTLIGVRVTGVYRDGVRLECQLREELKNALGTLHGGVYASLAELSRADRVIYAIERDFKYTVPGVERIVLPAGADDEVKSQTIAAAVRQQPDVVDW